MFSELITSELPKKEMSRAMSGLKVSFELNRLEELMTLLNQLEDDLKNSNDIKDLIEAKNFFSRILELSNSDEDNSNNSDVLNTKLRSARNYFERNYEAAVEDYLFIIEKNVNENGISKDELLSLFSFLETAMLLLQLVEVACLIYFINNEKSFSKSDLLIIYQYSFARGSNFSFWNIATKYF